MMVRNVLSAKGPARGVLSVCLPVGLLGRLIIAGDSECYVPMIVIGREVSTQVQYKHKYMGRLHIHANTKDLMNWGFGSICNGATVSYPYSGHPRYELW